MSTHAHDPIPELAFRVLGPEGPGHEVSPEADEHAETPDGMPLPAVLHRGRIVAGGRLYRHCRARRQACPAVELAPALDPDQVLGHVVELVQSLPPGPASLLLATRWQSGPSPFGWGPAPVSAHRAAFGAGVERVQIHEAIIAYTDPERIRPIWCASVREEMPTGTVACDPN